MRKILILYCSKNKQTFKISKFIQKKLSPRFSIKVNSISEVDRIDLFSFDKIVIGASIYYGKHSNDIIEFVKKYRCVLEQVKTAFFSVNAVARKTNKNLPYSNPYFRKFLIKTAWYPDLMAVFGGKIDYPNYKMFNKIIIYLIMVLTDGPKDIKTSHEFTKWEKVAQFSDKIVAL